MKVFLLCKIPSMSYVYFNPNPEDKDVGDFVVRAFAAATDSDWDTAFLKLVLEN